MNVLIKENHGLRSVNSTLEESRQTLELGLERADNLVRVLESENAGLHRQMSETGDFKKENEELKAEAAENTLFIETYKTRMEDKVISVVDQKGRLLSIAIIAQYRVLEDDYGTLLSQYQRLSEIFKGQKRLTDQGLLLESVHSLDDVRDLF